MSLLTDLDRAAMLDSKRRLEEAFALVFGSLFLNDKSPDQPEPRLWNTERSA